MTEKRKVIRAKTNPIRCNCGTEHELHLVRNTESRPIVAYGYIIEAGMHALLHFCKETNAVFIQ